MKKILPQFLFLIALLSAGFLSQAQIIFQKKASQLPSGVYTLDQVKADWNTTSATGFVKRGEGENRVYIDASQSPFAGGKSLRVKYPKGQHDSKPSGAQWKTDLNGKYDELYMAYYVKFSSDFEFDKIGKLPGLGGGLNFEDRDAATEWSGKLMWRKDAKGQFYVHQPIDSDKQYDWILNGVEASFSKNTWHHIEIHYELNTAGQNNGLMEAWLDGTLVGRVANYGKFRDNNNVGITMLFFSTFFGGNSVDNPDKDLYAWFDGFVVSQSRIGSGGGGNTGGGDVSVTGVSLTPSAITLDQGATRQLSASVSPSNATNKSVSYTSSNTSVVSVNGSGLVRAVSAGSATITVTTGDGRKTDTANITVAPSSSGCSGSGSGISSNIQAEDFCAMSGIQTQSTDDNGGGQNVGYIDAGDYMDYRVNIPSNGTYEVKYRVASKFASGKVDLRVNGSSKGEISIPNTGDWQRFETVSRNVTLSSGAQTIRLYATGSKWNINWFNLSPAGTNDNNNTSSCSFGAPSNSALRAFDEVTFTEMHKLGTGGPSLSNVTKLRINWDLSGNRLGRFAFNTSNGSPSYYVDLRSSMNHTFNTSRPDVSISSSGFAGFDGDYWVTNDGNNFVMVSKNGGFTLYFSNSSSSPSCSNSRTVQNGVSQSLEAAQLKVYPNPSTTGIFELNVEKNWSLYSLEGVRLKVGQGKEIDASGLSKGIYFLDAEGTKKRLILR